jgi:probable O-glycosylation ligase (exosortase A-associated)
MVLVMVLPLVFYLYQYSVKKIVKLGFISVFVVVCLAVIATNSRGGLLSLMIMALWIILKSKQKIRGVLAMTAVALLMLQLAPERWFHRMDTIQTADEDASFMGRVTAWKRASAIAMENPVFGGGLHAGQAQSIFEHFRYKEGLLGFVTTPNVGYAAASHSIYFEVLGDLGFVGLFLFLACLANAFITLAEIRKMVKIRGPSAEWALDLANMLTASLAAFVVGGAALSAAYFELPYFIIMLLEVVKLNVASLSVVEE